MSGEGAFVGRGRGVEAEVEAAAAPVVTLLARVGVEGHGTGAGRSVGAARQGRVIAQRAEATLLPGHYW